MISEELSAWLVARREVLDWTDQVTLIGLAVQAGGDDAFVTAVKAGGPALAKAVAGYDEALFKVGPHGYSHGWVKVGETSPSKMSVSNPKRDPDKFEIRDAKSNELLGSGKHNWGAGKDTNRPGYEVKHADGTKLGTFDSMARAKKAVADHHNDKYAAFDRDKEPELAGYHDAKVGRTTDPDDAMRRSDDYRAAYQRGRSAADSESTKSVTANKVGPKGYIHGWIKVGGAADSLDLHTDDAGKLTPKRAALHKKLINSALSGHESEEHPVATFLGGGPASGKTSVMKDSKGKLVIAADDLKFQLPEYKKMKANGDKRAAAFTHEESSHITGNLIKEATKRKTSFVLDGLGDSGIDKLAKKVSAIRAAGHTVNAKYVTVDTEEAVRRAKARAAETGFMVPEPALRAGHAAVSRTFKQAIDHNLFDTAELWDNNGREPKLIGRKLADGPFQVHDRAAWEKFLAKGQEA